MKSLCSGESLSLLQELFNSLSRFFVDLLTLSAVMSHFALLRLFTGDVPCSFRLLLRSAVLVIILSSLLLTVYLETIKSIIKSARCVGNASVTHG